jgi:hypothetical protein
MWPIREPGMPLPAFYTAWWTHFAGQVNPPGDAAVPVPGHIPPFAGTNSYISAACGHPPPGHHILVGVGFSGNGGARPVKVELYATDAGIANWAGVLGDLAAAAPWAVELAGQCAAIGCVHRHAAAIQAAEPGVYATFPSAGAPIGAPLPVPAPNVALPGNVPGALGAVPHIVVPGALAVERAGAAGRVACWAPNRFALNNQGDMNACGAWMVAMYRAFAIASANVP